MLLQFFAKNLCLTLHVFLYFVSGCTCASNGASSQCSTTTQLRPPVSALARTQASWPQSAWTVQSNSLVPQTEGHVGGTNSKSVGHFLWVDSAHYKFSSSSAFTVFTHFLVSQVCHWGVGGTCFCIILSSAFHYSVLAGVLIQSTVFNSKVSQF